MAQRVVWVHGIGQHSPGYSAEWEATFNPYLNLSHEAYSEVCWDTVFHAARALPGEAVGSAGGLAIPLTPREQQDEAEVREELRTILAARAAALEQPPPGTRARAARDAGVVAWSDLVPPAGTRGLLPDWLRRPDEYLGDFTKYLVSRDVRTAVKEQAKAVLRPFAGGEDSVAIIAHSWGTVVAYDSLLDLQVEQPALQMADLITLGSPLWLVRRLLEDRSARKPGQLAQWTNVHARGDLVGAWLSTGFRVDEEFEVPNFGGGDAHGSYFVEGNEAVQRDIVARAILAMDAGRAGRAETGRSGRERTNGRRRGRGGELA